MADYAIPKNGVAYIFYGCLVSQADTKLFKSAPTLAAGDFKVSIDGGAFANLATLPTNTPGTFAVKFSLSSGEMTGDNILVVASDAAGAEWCDQCWNIQTSARGIADLAYPTVSGRALDVSAGGEAGVDLANVGSPTTTLALTGTTIATTQKVDVDTIKTNPVVNGGTITFPTNKTLADTTGAVGSVTGAVGSVTAGVTVTTNNDKTGYGLSAAAVQAIWDALASALTTVGSIGKRIVDYLTGDAFARIGAAGAGLTALGDTRIANLDAAVSSRGTGTALDAAGVRSAVGLATANLDTQLAAIQADSPNRVTKNVALAGFTFFMRDSTNHAAATGLTITAQRSLDGAAFGACANSATEVSNGLYTIDLAAADLNGNVVSLRFTAAGADDLVISFPTQPT